MTATWKDFVDAFRTCAGTGETDDLARLITNDFTWPTSNMDRQEILDWTANTNFRITGTEVTLYENADVIAGTHDVLDDTGALNTVMGIAYLRDGKIHTYHHLRSLK